MTVYRIRLTALKTRKTSLLPDEYATKREATRYAVAWEETMTALDAHNENPIRARAVPSTPKNAAAVALGARGGRATSAAKTAAVRANGRKGGRPRKLDPVQVKEAPNV